MLNTFSASKNKLIIGSYELGSTIGQGTFGKVKIAKHLLTGENVAIKIFQKDRIQKEGQIKRVLQQIKILKQLNHPNIVQLYEIIQTSEKIYIVMQYIEKGELFTYIKLNKKIQQKIASKMYFELISAIQYLQKQNITHRDIKPENILLNQKLSIKIADFGLSNYFKQNKKLETSCGSPCYALPEMLIGQSYQPKKADVWSSGIVLFTMVCGYLPFEDNDVVSLYKKILKQPLEFLPEVSVELRDLLNNILHKSKEKRYTLEQIKYHKWLIKFCKTNYNPSQKQEIKPELINQLQLYGIQYSYAKYCIQIGKHNFVTTLYHLLKRKSQREPNFKLITSQSTCLSLKDKCNQSDSMQCNDSLFRNLDTNKIEGTQNVSSIEQVQQKNQEAGESKDKRKKIVKGKKSISTHSQDKNLISTQRVKKSINTQTSQKQKQSKQKQEPKPKKTKLQSDEYYTRKNNNKQKPVKKSSIYQTLHSQSKIICKQYEQNFEPKNKRASKHIKDES